MEVASRLALSRASSCSARESRFDRAVIATGRRLGNRVPWVLRQLPSRPSPSVVSASARAPAPDPTARVAPASTLTGGDRNEITRPAAVRARRGPGRRQDRTIPQAPTSCSPVASKPREVPLRGWARGIRLVFARRGGEHACGLGRERRVLERVFTSLPQSATADRRGPWSARDASSEYETGSKSAPRRACGGGARRADRRAAPSCRRRAG